MEGQLRKMNRPVSETEFWFFYYLPKNICIFLNAIKIETTLKPVHNKLSPQEMWTFFWKILYVPHRYWFHVVIIKVREAKYR